MDENLHPRATPQTPSVENSGTDGSRTSSPGRVNSRPFFIPTATTAAVTKRTPARTPNAIDPIADGDPCQRRSSFLCTNDPVPSRTERNPTSALAVLPDVMTAKEVRQLYEIRDTSAPPEAAHATSSTRHKACEWNCAARRLYLLHGGRLWGPREGADYKVDWRC